MRNGTRGSAAGFTNWMMLKVEDLEDRTIEEFCYAKGWIYHYGGPGRLYYDKPTHIVGKYHVLVKQNGGLDI